MRKLLPLVLLALLSGCSVASGSGLDPSPPPTEAVPPPSDRAPSPPVDEVVAPAGDVECPAVDEDYARWATDAGTQIMWAAQGHEARYVGSPILGGVVPTPEGDWQIMGSSTHESYYFAAPLPLSVGGDLVYLGGDSLKDGSWVWSPGLPADSPWRTTYHDDVMRALGLTDACMAEAYGYDPELDGPVAA
jgi:hypothetical protein